MVEVLLVAGLAVVPLSRNYVAMAWTADRVMEGWFESTRNHLLSGAAAHIRTEGEADLTVGLVAADMVVVGTGLVDVFAVDMTGEWEWDCFDMPGQEVALKDKYSVVVVVKAG